MKRMIWLLTVLVVLAVLPAGLAAWATNILVLAVAGFLVLTVRT